MSGRQFPVSSGETVLPASIQLIENYWPQKNKLTVLSKSKNVVEFVNNNGSRLVVMLEHKNGAWYLQEMKTENDSQAETQTGQIMMKERAVIIIGHSRRSKMRLYFHANFAQVLQNSNVLIAQEDMDRVLELFKRHLTCGICDALFIQPIILSCGHTFCTFCWDSWKEVLSNECLKCQQINNNKVVVRNFPLMGLIETNRMLKSVINKLVVSANSESGVGALAIPGAPASSNPRETVTTRSTNSRFQLMHSLGQLLRSTYNYIRSRRTERD